jgi:hypothetical protein
VHGGSASSFGVLENPTVSLKVIEFGDIVRQDSRGLDGSRFSLQYKRGVSDGSTFTVTERGHIPIEVSGTLEAVWNLPENEFLSRVSALAQSEVTGLLMRGEFRPGATIRLNTYSVQPWRQFEDLVRRILELNAYKVSLNTTRGDAGFDLWGLLNGERWAIEVKYYRTARAQPNLIEAAAHRVAVNGAKANATKALLVVSCVLPEALRRSLEEQLGIAFADRNDLKVWASTAPQLAAELDSLVEAEPSPPPEVPSGRQDPRSSAKNLSSGPPPVKASQGADLCIELKAVRAGKAGWAAYERLCERCLNYLFKDDLEGWHKQKRTDDGLNRYDFVCRIRPTTDFWSFLIDHLNSRYVLFEFKNYTGQIRQGQILTTEKYLLEKGLRKVAIIFSRKGGDKNAYSMTQGAMREHGKLMLLVDDEKLCEMLRMKDRGNDPTDRLFQLADDFLLALPR